MAEILVVAERQIGAPAALAYEILANYRDHHPKILPPAFSDFVVEQGGHGAGTVVSFTMTAGRRTRRGTVRVTEPEPGRVLVESAVNSSLVTTFTVEPEGAASRVRFETRWQSARGIGGLFERLFAPRVLRRIYAEELGRLDRYARELAASTA